MVVSSGRVSTAPRELTPQTLFGGWRGKAFGAFLAYGIPLNVTLAAFIPSDMFRGIFYSVHGGYAWLVILGSLPWVCFIGVLFSVYNTWKTFAAVLIGYIPVSMACAALLSAALNPPLGLTVKNTTPHFWFPVGLLLKK